MSRMRTIRRARRQRPTIRSARLTPVGGNIYTKAGSLTPFASVTGADSAVTAETGALVADTSLSGSRFGTVTPAPLPSFVTVEIDFDGNPSAGYFDQLRYADAVESYWRNDSVAQLTDEFGVNTGSFPSASGAVEFLSSTF